MNCFYRFDHNFQGNIGNYTASSTNSLPKPAANYAAMYVGREIVTHDSNNLMQKNDYNCSEQVHIGNGKGLKIKHIRSSLVHHASNPNKTLLLTNLLHVLQITENLINKCLTFCS